MERGSTAALSIWTPPRAATTTSAVLRYRFCLPKRHVSIPKQLSLLPTTHRASNYPIWSAPKQLDVARNISNLRAGALLGGAGGTVLQDAGATMAVMAGAYGLVSTFDFLSKRNIIEQSLSRKLVHILSGLLFMGCWPIFSTSIEARYFASLVPLANGLRLVVHGLSLVTNEDLIKSVTREGKPEELLRGPLYYVLVLILSSLVFWRESPVGVVSLAMMCGGDGVADIMGQRFGSIKIPYNQQKSWAGSISMFAFGFLMSIGMLYYFSIFGYFQLDWTVTIERVALVSLVGTVVESLPTTGVVDDNLSVPLASMVMFFLWSFIIQCFVILASNFVCAKHVIFFTGAGSTPCFWTDFVLQL